MSSPRFPKVKFRSLLPSLALGSLLLCAPDAIAGSTPADAPAIRRLLSDVRRVMERIHTPLDLDDQQLSTLAAQAREMIDARSGRTYRTREGRPLPYYVIDPETSSCHSETPLQTVLYLGTIHPDEVSPCYSSFQTLMELIENPRRRPPNTRVIFAPLVNPDGLVGSILRTGHSTRANGAGVDLNRDFRSARPETETRFVQQLIAEYRPSHIVSLHGPFGWHDYDGPAEAPGSTPEMRNHVSEWLTRTNQAGRVPMGINQDFGVYRGSLGDYAGSGLRRHVLTIELPHEEGRFAREDWQNFGGSLIESLNPGPLAPGVVPPMPDSPLPTPTRTLPHRTPAYRERFRPTQVPETSS